VLAANIESPWQEERPPAAHTGLQATLALKGVLVHSLNGLFHGDLLSRKQKTTRAWMVWVGFNSVFCTAVLDF
jgi:hypothetical protein